MDQAAELAGAFAAGDGPGVPLKLMNLNMVCVCKTTSALYRIAKLAFDSTSTRVQVPFLAWTIGQCLHGLQLGDMACCLPCEAG